MYSINREKPHQPITFSFVVRICSQYCGQMFISGEMLFQVALVALQQRNNSILLVYHT